MNEQKIKELFSDEQFVKELLDLETPEEVQAVLADNDVDFSIEDIIKLKELLIKKEADELSDEELEEVAGGNILRRIKRPLRGQKPEQKDTPVVKDMIVEL